MPEGKYVGYLNTSKLYVDQLSNPNLNPNGICKITLNAAVPPIGTGSGDSSEIYSEIFNQGNSKGPCVSENINTKISQLFYNSNGFTKTIYCCVGDDIQFGGSNNWEESIDKAIKEAYSMAKDSLKGKYEIMLKGAEAAYAALTGSMGIKVQTLVQTIKFWMGSADPGPFNLRFNMLATAPDTDIRKELLALYATVFPVQMGGNSGEVPWKSGSVGEIVKSLFGKITGDLQSAILIAPLGYNPVDAYKSSVRSSNTDAGSGLIDIKIGKWLHLPNMIAKDFNANISRVTTRYGFPLYAKCNLTIVPCRAWRLNDVRAALYSQSYQDSMSDGEDAISKYKLGETP